MRSILLSIKPEYVDKILAGTKLYEFRKRIATEKVEFIYIYSTSPIMKIVARVSVDNVIKASPTALWEETKHSAGISRKDYRIYFKGCKFAFAYKLGTMEVFNPPKNLQDFGVDAPPQSFVYLPLDTKN